MVTRNRVGTQAVSGVTATSTQPGQTPGGGSTNDNRTPSGPTTLAVTNLGVTWQAGAYLGSGTLTWVLPTTATDGSAMAPASSHVYQYGGAGTGGAFSQLTVLDYPDVSVNFSGYAPDSTWQFKVRCVGANGKLSAFTNTVTVVMKNSSAATGPSAPSTPEVDPEGVVIKVRWDGLAFGGGPMPADFSFCSIERAHSSAFAASDIAVVGSFITEGDFYDGPLTPGDTWYYRLVPYNLLDLRGAPSQSQPATVGTIPGDTITKNTITTDQMDAALMATITQAAGNAPPPGTALPGNHIFYGTTPDPNAVIGDLWFNPNDHNIPYILQGIDPTKLTNWIAYRDKIVNDAFSGTGGPNGITITAPYLLPSVVRGQLIAADLITASDIVATGTITSTAALFGVVDAAILTTGYLDANRIHADTIDSTKLIVADLANLCDEGEFDSAQPTAPDTFDFSTDPAGVRVKGAVLPAPWPPTGWIDPNAKPNGNNGRRAITDHPTANASTGYVYSVIGVANAGKQTIKNKRIFPALITDQFFGQLYVRKVGNATTGKVTFALTVDLKAGGTAPDPTTSTPTTVFFSKTFLTTDSAGTWTALPILFDSKGVPTPLGQNGSISPDNSHNPKPTDPRDPWTPVTQALPTGAFQATATIIVENLAQGQEIQVASVWVRRKGTGQLIVDGTITADHMDVGTITSAEIAAGTIKATNIGVGEIYSDNIHTGTIQASDMQADALTTFLVNGGIIRTSAMVLDKTQTPPVPMPPVAGTYPFFEINANSMFYQTALNTPPLFQMIWKGTGAGTMSFRSSTGTASQWVIDTAGIRFYGTGGTAAPPTIMLNNTAGTYGGVPVKAGSAYFQGDISGSKFIAGSDPASSYLQTGSTGTRVVMDSTGLSMYYDVAGAATTKNPVFALTNIPTATQPNHVMLTSKPGRTNTFDAGWVLSDAGLFMYDGTYMTFGVYAKDSGANKAGDAHFRGTITASKLDATNSITGALIQTSVSTDFPRISLSASGDGTSQVATFWVQDQYGSSLAYFKADKVNTNAAFYFDSNPQMTVAANVGHDQPRLLIDSLNYFRFYSGKKNSAGNWIIPFNIDFKSGSVTMIGTLTASAIIGSTIDTTSTITGAVVRTSSGTSRIEMADAGITHYLAGVALSSWSATGGINFKSAAAGSRVVLASTGLFLYNDSSALTVSMYASDGSAHFTGSITATSGTFTGVIHATDGYFSGDLTASATILGTINGTVYVPGTINNNGGSFSNGGGVIGGGLIQTSPGSNRIQLTNDQIQVYSGGAFSGLIEQYSHGSSNDMMMEGVGANGGVWLGYNGSAGGGQFLVNNGSGSSGGLVRAYAIAYSPISSISGYAPVYIASSVTNAYVAMYTSSVRYKKAIRPLALHPGFMDIEASTWGDKPGRATVDVRISNPGIARRNTGFTAENLHRAGLFDAVTYDARRHPNGIQQPAIMAHTVAHTQHLMRQVQELTARVAALEGAR